jgi:large subunit ribosomal protein L9
MMLFQAFILVVTLRFSNFVGASRTYRASFVPPASPRRTSSQAPTAIVASGYGLCSTDTTTLFAKKKVVAAAPKKIQVKLLKHIAGTGQAGEVIMVTPAFFNNKLRPTKSAEIISDEQVEKERAESKARQAALNAAANEIVDTLQDFVLSIRRKSGPDGQLFGGIGPKLIMEELSKQLPNALWSEKSTRITKLMDDEGQTLKGDIKHIGTFSADVSLTKEVTAHVEISIVEES